MDDNNNGSKNETEIMSSIWLRRLLCLKFFCAIFFFIWEYYSEVFYLKAKLWLPFSLPF